MAEQWYFPVNVPGGTGITLFFAPKAGKINRQKNS
jgi:hypothetical protein